MISSNIQFKVDRCNNSTRKGPDDVQCAPSHEIEAYIYDLFFSMWQVKQFMDFENYKQPPVYWSNTNMHVFNIANDRSTEMQV